MQKWRMYVYACYSLIETYLLLHINNSSLSLGFFFCVLCLPVLFPVLCSVLSSLLFLLAVFFDLACIVPLCFLAVYFI